VLTTVDTAP